MQVELRLFVHPRMSRQKLIFPLTLQIRGRRFRANETFAPLFFYEAVIPGASKQAFILKGARALKDFYFCLKSCFIDGALCEKFL